MLTARSERESACITEEATEYFVLSSEIEDSDICYSRFHISLFAQNTRASEQKFPLKVSNATDSLLPSPIAAILLVPGFKSCSPVRVSFPRVL